MKKIITILATLAVLVFSGCGSNSGSSSQYDFWEYRSIDEINKSSRGIDYIEDENGTLIKTNSGIYGPYSPVSFYYESSDILVEDYYEDNQITKNIKKNTTIESKSINYD